jgi:hypothetical protein
LAVSATVFALSLGAPNPSLAQETPEEYSVQEVARVEVPLNKQMPNFVVTNYFVNESGGIIDSDNINNQDYKQFQQRCRKSIDKIYSTEIGKIVINYLIKRGIKIRFAPADDISSRSAANMTNISDNLGNSEFYVQIPLTDYNGAVNVGELLNFIGLDENQAPYFDLYEKTVFHEIVHLYSILFMAEWYGNKTSEIPNKLTNDIHTIQSENLPNILNVKDFKNLAELLSMKYEAQLGSELDYIHQRDKYGTSKRDLHIAKALGLTGETDKEILDKLYNLPVEKLRKMIEQFMNEKHEKRLREFGDF